MQPSLTPARRYQRFVFAWAKYVVGKTGRDSSYLWLRVMALSCVALLGCAAQPPTRLTTDQSTVSRTDPPGYRELSPNTTPQATDTERLAQLWRQRTHEQVIADYPIGAGDVLEISVPGMDEIQERTVRVSGEGTVTLPLVGTIRATGLTEEELREALRRRLEQFMHRPQLNLYVREYRSRQVAVIGAVTKPGLYSPSSEKDTILDMVTMAGGMTPEAAARVLLIPAERAGPEAQQEVVAALPVQFLSEDRAPLILKQTDPITIDLQYFTRGAGQQYLPLPVRPGDVIMVPGSGEVLVQGWVGKPGAYKITPGLTLMGAVAAAGGPLFPADLSAISMIRSGKQGEKQSHVVNLDKVKRGEEPDMTVQEGDVIEVTSSTPKLIPYGMYRFFTSIFHIGAGLPLF
jgi:polysaccharide biosynthesis/export protein